MSQRPARILVVDDEHTLRESCASELRLEGYAVTVCARAEEALSAFQRRAFDIVLLDLYMGQALGMALLRSCLGHRLISAPCAMSVR